MMQNIVISYPKQTEPILCLYRMPWYGLLLAWLGNTIVKLNFGVHFYQPVMRKYWEISKKYMEHGARIPITLAQVDEINHKFWLSDI